MKNHLLRPLLLTVLVAVVLAWPAWAWGGEMGLVALTVAGGICLIAAWLALVPRLFLSVGPQSDANESNAVLAATGVRLLATMVGALVVLMAKPFDTWQFIAWLAAFYSVHLVLEVFVSLRDLGQNHARSGTRDSETSPESSGRERSHSGGAEEANEEDAQGAQKA